MKSHLKENHRIFNSDLVNYNFLDDDMPTPTLSEFSDEEGIVAAAESLVAVKSKLSNIDVEMTDTESSQMIKTESESSTHQSKKLEDELNSLNGQEEVQKNANEGSEVQSSLSAPKTEAPSVNVLEDRSLLNQASLPKTVIPYASPLQIQKIKHLLDNVQDDLEEVRYKKARIASIYEEAKELEIKSKFMDEKNQSYPPIIPPAEIQELDDTLIELMNDHISELQDKVKNAIKTRKKMFSTIEGLESSRAAKDQHFRQSFSSTFGAPLDQITSLLNDESQEGSNDGRFNQ